MRIDGSTSLRKMMDKYCDFPILETSFKFNCMVSMDEKNPHLKITKIPLKVLNEKLKIIVETSTKEEDVKGKLLE